MDEQKEDIALKSARMDFRANQISLWVAGFSFAGSLLIDASSYRWAVFGVALIYLSLKVLPEFLEERRQKQVRELGVGGKPVTSAYFQLAPRDAGEPFWRPDDCHKKLLALIRQSADPVLYLTGDSGCGKTSVVQAYLLPKLTKRNSSGAPRIKLMRIYDNPMAVLAAAFPGDFPNLRARLTSQRSLLIILDQFEELVIHQHAERQQEFAAFLKEFVQDPVPDVRFLLVFRKDYQAQLVAAGFPPNFAVNAIEVGPFDQRASLQFLRESKIELSKEFESKILSEAAEIEPTPGYIRPITLNFFGLIIKPFVQVPAGYQPGALLRSHVMHLLKRPDLGEPAVRILQQMVSGVATKRPCQLDDLARTTRLSRDQVRGYLLILNKEAGLVRELDAAGGTWEVSHDFVARILERVVNNWKAGALKDARRWLAPASAILWVVSLIWLYPWWQGQSLREAKSGLSALGCTVREEATLQADCTRMNAGDLHRAVEILSRIPGLLSLDLSGTLVRNIQPLAKLARLQSLNLSGTQVASLEALAKLHNLRSLDLSTPILLEELSPLQVNLETLAGLGGLRSLNLEGSVVRSVEHLAKLTNLESLNLSRTKFSNVDILSRLSRLQHLDLSFTKVTRLRLPQLTQLRHLNLSGTRITDLQPLVALTNLQSLELAVTEVSDIEPLANLNNLQSLHLSDTKLTKLGPLAELANLQSLQLSNTRGTDFTALAKLINLQSLDLSKTKISNLEVLRRLSNLRWLELSNTEVTDLEPLSGLIRLQRLLMSETKVNKLDPLAKLTNIEQLSLQTTALTSLEPLAKLTRLKLLHLSTAVQNFKPLCELPVKVNFGSAGEFRPSEHPQCKETSKP